MLLEHTKVVNGDMLEIVLESLFLVAEAAEIRD